MATTVPSVDNVELDLKEAGRHRLQNLELPPFSFPPPVCINRDVTVDHNALWILNL